MQFHQNSLRRLLIVVPGLVLELLWLRCDNAVMRLLNHFNFAVMLHITHVATEHRHRPLTIPMERPTGAGQ